MFSLTLIALVALGFLLLPLTLWGGAACLAAAYGLRQLAVREEEGFTAFLMVLGGLGALAQVLEGVWLEFIARL